MMKQNKKSLIDLMGDKQIDVEELKKVKEKIHGGFPEQVQVNKKEKKSDSANQPKTLKIESKRVCIDLPMNIYIRTQKQAFQEDKMPLKHFVEKCVEYYLNAHGAG